MKSFSRAAEDGPNQRHLRLIQSRQSPPKLTNFITFEGLRRPASECMFSCSFYNAFWVELRRWLPNRSCDREVWRPLMVHKGFEVVCKCKPITRQLKAGKYNFDAHAES